MEHKGKSRTDPIINILVLDVSNLNNFQETLFLSFDKRDQSGAKRQG